MSIFDVLEPGTCIMCLANPSDVAGPEGVNLVITVYRGHKDPPVDLTNIWDEPAYIWWWERSRKTLETMHVQSTVTRDREIKNLLIEVDRQGNEDDVMQIPKNWLFL